MDNESIEPLTRKEHNPDGAAKRVQIRVLDPSDGIYYSVGGSTPGSAVALNVAVVDGSGNQVTSFGPGTQYADGDARGTATGTLGMVDDGTLIQSQAGDSDGNAKIVGNVAAASADSGNPVKTGGKHYTTQPTYTDGQRTEVQTDTRGNQRMTIMSGGTVTGWSFVADNADAVAVSATAARGNVMAKAQMFNGTTWDRVRGDTTNGLDVDVTRVSGTVTVDGSGVTQPVSGTVTANLSATDNAVLDAIEADTTTLAGAVAGTEMQVDVVGALPAGTNTIGAVEVEGTALSNNQVTVDTTAGGVTILAASAGRAGAIITNQGSVACFIGTGSVSTSNGFSLAAGESVALPTDSDIKGITASSSTTVGYLAFA